MHDSRWRARRLPVLLFITVLGLSVTAPTWAADNRLTFDNLWEQYASVDEIQKDRLGTANPGFDSLRKEATYYLQLGLNLPTSDRRKMASLEKAITLLEGLNKKKQETELIQVLLGYAYTGYAAANSNLEVILKYIFRARNMYSLAIDRLPENIDIRLGRAHINMNLTPQTGRPDKLVEEDARVYLAGYEQLDAGKKSDAYFLMGRSLMNLALATVLADRNDVAQARTYLGAVTVADIPAADSAARQLYARYASRLK